MSLLPSCAALELRLLPSAGITQLLRYYEPLRHPAGPSWSSRIPGWRVRATDGASRVAAVSPLHACRRQYPRRNRSVPASPRFPTAVSLPRINGGSASALPVSRPAQRSLRVAACVLAESPSGDPSSSECFSAVRYLPAPLRTASGWSDSCRAGFAPAGTQRLSTAHVESRRGAPGRRWGE